MRFDRITLDDGLSQSNVFAILHDSQLCVPAVVESRSTLHDHRCSDKTVHVCGDAKLKLPTEYVSGVYPNLLQYIPVCRISSQRV